MSSASKANTEIINQNIIDQEHSRLLNTLNPFRVFTRIKSCTEKKLYKYLYQFHQKKDLYVQHRSYDPIANLL